jgi:hypothetical protein
MSLYLSVSVYLPSISPKPNLTYLLICLPADLPTSTSPPPSLFPDKKFPVAEAHFCFDKLIYLFRLKQDLLVQVSKTVEQDCHLIKVKIQGQDLGSRFRVRIQVRIQGQKSGSEIRVRNQGQDSG